jgi:hypothetical protein
LNAVIICHVSSSILLHKLGCSKHCSYDWSDNKTQLSKSFDVKIIFVLGQSYPWKVQQISKYFLFQQKVKDGRKHSVVTKE